ncbi:MAG TPA: hypothetical protein VKY85_22225 [Candidatus Angelobacter sp.]|jgi:hypothetical protein|nr:hypothetical protein [Candidatus Angelobacter sp.]
MARIWPFDIKRLKQFHRHGNQMPKPAPEEADKISDLDPDLKPDEQMYVGHYLAYADVLLNDLKNQGAGDQPLSSVVELPQMEDFSVPEESDNNGNDKAA